MKKSLILGAVLLSAIAAGAQKYNMVVETTDGQKTVIPVDDIDNMSMTPQPDYIESDHLVYALYTTQLSNPGRATYRIDFANAPADQNGLPVSKGDMVVSMEFTAPASAENSPAILPAGNYSAGNNTANFTFNCAASDVAIRVADGNDQDAISYEVIIGGYVDVNLVDGEYDIRAELTTISGLSLNASYCGPIRFVNNPANSGTFADDFDVTFENAQGRFYGNWYYPFSDDMMLQLYTGTIENGKQTEGYWLELETNLPKAADPTALTSPRVADGVYTVDTREDPASFYYCYQPFTFVSGKVIDFFGQPTNIGSTITHIDKDGTLRLAHISGGTVTVSGNGTRFDFDLTTSAGVKVTGSYSGTPNIHNLCDNFDSQPARPFSTLEDDYSMNFADNAIALAYDEGNNFLIQGKKSIYLMVSDPQRVKGDYIAFDLISDENGLVDGTYTVNDTFEPFGVLKGRANYSGSPIFSWFGNLEDIDPDGYNNIMAPVNGGTFTVATDAQGVSTITFNLTDDNGHAITGSWSGTITRVSDEDLAAPARKAALRMR